MVRKVTGQVGITLFSIISLLQIQGNERPASF